MSTIILEIARAFARTTRTEEGKGNTAHSFLLLSLSLSPLLRLIRLRGEFLIFYSWRFVASVVKFLILLTVARLKAYGWELAQLLVS
jgi:hypothetical protein